MLEMIPIILILVIFIIFCLVLFKSVKLPREIKKEEEIRAELTNQIAQNLNGTIEQASSTIDPTFKVVKIEKNNYYLEVSPRINLNVDANIRLYYEGKGFSFFIVLVCHEDLLKESFYVGYNSTILAPMFRWLFNADHIVDEKNIRPIIGWNPKKEIKIFRKEVDGKKLLDFIKSIYISKKEPYVVLSGENKRIILCVGKKLEPNSSEDMDILKKSITYLETITNEIKSRRHI